MNPYLVSMLFKIEKQSGFPDYDEQIRLIYAEHQDALLAKLAHIINGEISHCNDPQRRWRFEGVKMIRELNTRSEQQQLLSLTHENISGNFPILMEETRVCTNIIKRNTESITER